MSVCLSVCLSVYLSVCLPVCLPVCPSASLSACSSVCVLCLLCVSVCRLFVVCCLLFVCYMLCAACCRVFGVVLFVVYTFVCFCVAVWRWRRSKADACVSEVRVGSPGSVRAGDAATPRLRTGEGIDAYHFPQYNLSAHSDGGREGRKEGGWEREDTIRCHTYELVSLISVVFCFPRSPRVPRYFAASVPSRTRCRCGPFFFFFCAFISFPCTVVCTFSSSVFFVAGVAFSAFLSCKGEKALYYAGP